MSCSVRCWILHNGTAIGHVYTVRRYANKCVWALVGLYWQGKVDILGNNPVPAPICPPQILQRSVWDPAHALAVTGQRRMWRMAGLLGVAC